MTLVALRSPVVKGAGLDHVLGRSYSTPALIALLERPGIGTHQLAMTIAGTGPTVAALVKFLEQEGLLRKEDFTGAGPQRSALYLTPAGERLALDLRSLSERHFPDETAAPEVPRATFRRIIEMDGAKETIAALERTGHLPLERLHEVLGLDRWHAQSVRLELERAGIAAVTAVTRKGAPEIVLALTEKGRRVAFDLAAERGPDDAGAEEKEEKARRALRGVAERARAAKEDQQL
jgi:DNA-binding MarR family transcriptional regulator